MERRYWKGQGYHLRPFRCPECGKIQYLPKHRRNTPPGHLKDCFCLWCGKYVKLEQIDEERLNYEANCARESRGYTPNYGADLVITG